MENKLYLFGEFVTHKNLGQGKIIEQTDNSVIVDFGKKKMRFQLPQAFDGFLICEDKNIQSKLKLQIDNIKEVEEKKKQVCSYELERVYQAKQDNSKPTYNSKKNENLAFKCNFCNGGESDTCIGYKCVCSDDIIEYNINVAKRSWCCDNDAPCKMYYDGKINREELDAFIENDSFICYESQMLRNWEARTGTVLKGGNKGKPKKFNEVRLNKLAILTTREPYADESERIVFAVFIIDDAYEGDDSQEGYVASCSKYRINLSLDEARQIKFWNYYHNGNSPEKAHWGTGLYRNVTNIQAANILKDIAKIKIRTDDGILAKEIFEHFCKINALTPNNIPTSDGALKK